jgi:hypothetical protein
VKDPARAPSVHARIVSGAVLAVLIPASLLLMATQRPTPALALHSVVALYAGVALALILTSNEIRIVSFGFWLFAYIWLGLAPVAMLSTDEYPWPLRVHASVSFRASLIVLVGLAAYSIGSLVASRLTPPDRDGFAGRLLTRPLSLPRVLVLGVASLCIAVILIPRLGGLGAFFESRQAANVAATAVAGESGRAGLALVDWGLAVPAFWAFLGFLHVRRVGKDEPALSTLWLALLVPVVALNVVVNNPASQPRFWAGTVLLTLLFASKPLKSVRVFKIAGVSLLVAAVILFPVSDYFRNDRREVLQYSVVEHFLTNPDYDSYQQIQAGTAMVHEFGHQPQLAVGPPLFWVPRAVWPDKPEDAGVVIARFAGYRFLNLSSPLWIETYIWGGLPLVAILFAILGAISRRVDQLYHQYRYTKGLVLGLLVPALAFYQVLLLRGSLLQAMAPLTLLVTIPFLISKAPRRSVEPSSAARDRAQPIGAAPVWSFSATRKVSARE